MITLKVQPLTRAGFAPFGDVIEPGIDPMEINAGFAKRFDDLCTVDLAREGGDVNVAMFIAKARAMPLTITMMERHPLGSQAFIPMQNAPWLTVVCTDPGDASTYLAFAVSGTQGINYRRNAWHFPLTTFGDGDRFLIIDRKGPGDNLDVHDLAPAQQISVIR